MAEDAVHLPPPVAARGGGAQLVLPSDQQVAGRRVARPLVATARHRRVAFCMLLAVS